MWIDKLKYDPFQIFSEANNPVINYFVKTDLLGQHVSAPDVLWHLPEVKRIIKQQRGDGAWQYKGNRPGDAHGENYELLETWRKMSLLINCYAMDKSHPALRAGAEFIFSCQTEEGDIRGILSNQYIPYYMGVILETLIKAGYEQDKRTLRAFDWLSSMRQEDGGWIIPMNMFKMHKYKELCQGEPIPPDKTLRFSHLATGMVLRGYAVHPELRKSQPATIAARLIKSRLFERDTFSSRQAKKYWFKFRYPFWWTELVSVLDSLKYFGFSISDQKITEGIQWLIDQQEENGGWKSAYEQKNQPVNLWVSLAICRVLKYYLDA